MCFRDIWFTKLWYFLCELSIPSWEGNGIVSLQFLICCQSVYQIYLSMFNTTTLLSPSPTSLSHVYHFLQKAAFCCLIQVWASAVARALSTWIMERQPRRVYLPSIPCVPWAALQLVLLIAALQTTPYDSGTTCSLWT